MPKTNTRKHFFEDEVIVQLLKNHTDVLRAVMFEFYREPFWKFFYRHYPKVPSDTLRWIWMDAFVEFFDLLQKSSGNFKPEMTLFQKLISIGHVISIKKYKLKAGEDKSSNFETQLRQLKTRYESDIMLDLLKKFMKV